MEPVRIMLVAGEPSGDVLGGHLMRALRTLAGHRAEIFGVGGDAMAAEGLESIFPMSDLSVMGLFEILPRAPTILRRLKEAEACARERRPHVLVTIDSPGFNKRLVRRLQDLETIRVHYVAPSVWAYRPKRAVTMAALYDHLLTLLPFEPPLFEKEGLDATFVGHPAIEAERAFEGDVHAFRESLGLPSHRPAIAVLFGSRRGEVARLGPIFADALRRLAKRVPEAHVLAPTLPHLRDDVDRLLASQPMPYSVLGQERKMDAFHAADSALAASGTVALELALAGTPAVVAYRMNALTAALARRLIRIPYASLVNILMQRAVVPELLQEHCTAGPIAAAMERIMTDPAARDAQIESGRTVAMMLKPGALWPSDKAARVILNLADQNREKDA